MIKRISYLILINILFICVAVFSIKHGATQTVYAEQVQYNNFEYARILTENTYFYADPNCQMAKFCLPYGYFVKVLSIGEDSVRIVYMDDGGDIPAREGYIKTSCFHPFDQTVENPYPKVTLMLRYDEVLFADSKLSTPKTVLPVDEKAYFYGEATLGGEKYYYVYAKGYVGYVRKSAFLSTQIPDHPLPIKTSREEEQNSAQTQSSQKQTTPYATGLDSTVKTVIIIAVSVVALSVVYLLFKPSAKANYAATKKDFDDDFNF